MIVCCISNVEWLLKNQGLKNQSIDIIGVMPLSVLDENQEQAENQIFTLEFSLKSVAESFETEANDMFEAASKAGIFLSKFQRSTYNVDHLKGQPYWEPDELGLTIKEKVLQKSHVL